ncbi:MAG: 3-oxoacyl-ACP reductase FabG [Succinivibrio sp.]|nr:3-oxoacyl-ACP reductase FabG [Succinivibrio sp.]
MMKRVLVTGAGTGLGKDIAIELCKNDFEVVLHYRSSKSGIEDALSRINELGKKATSLCFDITDRAQCKQILEQDIEQNGSYYGIVCNAGITKDAAFPMMTDDDWDSVVRTNIDGFYNVVKPCIMPMIAAHEGGRIIAISSVSGIMGNRGQVNYSASKAALIGAVKALALEVAKRNITVNAVAPGLIDTQMTELDETVKKEILKMIPLKRMGKPQDVADTVAFLMSDKANYITRQVISVNGGLL